MDLDSASNSEYDSDDLNSVDMYEKIWDYGWKTRIKGQLPEISSAAPSQDSSQHILTVLSDECIQHILHRLIGNIRDFLSAAEVCKRFQDNAKKCFPSIYQDFEIINISSLNALPLIGVIRFLRIFGSLIRSIQWKGPCYSHSPSILPSDAEMFETIAKYCGKSLIKFECDHLNFDFTHGSDFDAIKELIIGQGIISNFKIPSGLKTLRLRCTTMHMDCNFEFKVPTLIEGSFLTVKSFDEKCLVEFLRSNPQLKRLSFAFRDIITLPILEEIALRTPNLIKLKILNTDLSEASCMSLICLRKLKSLNLYNCIFPNGLIDSIIEAEIPLEKLEISAKSVNNLQNIQKLFLLKKLRLWFVSNETVIIEIVKNLPLLEQLSISSSNVMTVDGVKQILEHGRSLRNFNLRERHIPITLEDYQSILGLAKHRVTVGFNFDENKLQFDRKIVQENFKWIRYLYEWDDNLTLT